VTQPRGAAARKAAARKDATAPLPDSVRGQILFRAPEPWRPYLELARLDRPIGWWLLVLPCWWSSLLASLATDDAVHIRDLVLFLIGAVAMRGCGSTYNDIVDREIDASVARTRGRPLPSGRVGVGAAKRFLVAQALIGLAVLLQFDLFSIRLGMASLLPVAIYPFMKRITSWPQAVLGLAFAWGALMGWAAVTGSLALAPLLLYLGAVLWTIGFDTIYALQDIEDDARMGIGSTARAFGPHVRAAVAALYAGSALAIAAALVAAGVPALAYLGPAGFALHLTWQAWHLKSADPARALSLFRSNRDAGLLLVAGLALAAVLRQP
jgi:4-hydroxybenzoate polyprenyltransferase